MQTHPSPRPSPLRGERVNPSVRGEQSRHLGFPLRGCALFPLPEGEGQGAGKRRERPTRVSDQSRNCGTGRTHRRSRRSPKWQ